MRRPFLARWPIWLVLPLALAGCPNSVDELFDESRILNASATPNPVPAPTDRESSAFTLRVDSDSNGDSDRLHVYMRNPARNGEWHLLAEHSPCPGGSNSGGCGNNTRTIECLSALIDAPDGQRLVNCGSGPGSLHVPAGTHRFRVDIIQCIGLGFGCSERADDTIEFDVTLR